MFNFFFWNMMALTARSIFPIFLGGDEMVFSDDTIKRAWQSAGGQCECRRIAHDHPYIRCGRDLVWENRGREAARGAWEARHIHSVQSGGSDALSNCEILCWECHLKTL